MSKKKSFIEQFIIYRFKCAKGKFFDKLEVEGLLNSASPIVDFEVSEVHRDVSGWSEQLILRTFIPPSFRPLLICEEDLPKRLIILSYQRLSDAEEPKLPIVDIKICRMFSHSFHELSGVVREYDRCYVGNLFAVFFKRLVPGLTSLITSPLCFLNQITAVNLDHEEQRNWNTPRTRASYSQFKHEFRFGYTVDLSFSGLTFPLHFNALSTPGLSSSSEEQLCIHCFPSGVRLNFMQSTPPAKKIFTFITNEVGERTFLTGIKFTKPIKSKKAVNLLRLYCSWLKKQLGFNFCDMCDLSKATENIVIQTPMAFLALSRKDQSLTLPKILNWLYRFYVSNSSMNILVKKYILPMLKPISGPGAWISLNGVFEDHLLLNDVDQAPKFKLSFFSVLSVDTFIDAFFLALTEEKLVIVSSSHTFLMDILLTLEAGMFPIKYCHPCIPIMPYIMLEVLESPGSFIIGVSERNFSRYKSVIGSDINVLYIDQNHLQLAACEKVLDANARSISLLKQFQRYVVAPRKTTIQRQRSRSSGDENRITPPKCLRQELISKCSLILESFESLVKCFSKESIDLAFNQTCIVSECSTSDLIKFSKLFEDAFLDLFGTRISTLMRFLALNKPKLGLSKDFVELKRDEQLFFEGILRTHNAQAIISDLSYFSGRIKNIAFEHRTSKSRWRKRSYAGSSFRTMTKLFPNRSDVVSIKKFKDVSFSYIKVKYNTAFS
eukprot:augustus_masked-scaffold_41-processed-gene-0.37-mRNA-1 protein AED:1.00 eAED:1.00 QI:0/-1/0/0/-1/1/1/0/720